ncbi:hypothetical protein MTO96_020447 [Rhipicephalus appendiculatus]
MSRLCTAAPLAALVAFPGVYLYQKRNETVGYTEEGSPEHRSKSITYPAELIYAMENSCSDPVGLPGSGLVPDLSDSQIAARCFDIARGFVPPCENLNGACCFSDSNVEGCNKALWCVGLQIRQDIRDEMGKVSIAVVRKLRSGFLRQYLETESGLIALAVLRFLWEQHGCVVAVQVFDVLLKAKAVFDGRLGKPRLRRLTIVMDPDECPFRVIDLAKHIGWMAIDAGVELRFIDGVYRLDAGESLLLALLGVGHLRARLTVLDLTGLAVEAVVAERIVDALLQNDSVTDLAVGSNIFAFTPECKSSERFAMYLTGMKATLRRLYLDACNMTEESNSSELWATLVQAISKMTVLEELVARGLGRAGDIGLFGSVLVSNKSLRVLEVWGRPCCDQGAHQRHLRASEASVMESWISGLKRHYYLRRLAVDLSLWTLEECRLFISAIADAPIRKVTLRNIADDGCLQALYATLREHKISRRVIVEDPHVGPADVKVLRSHPEASAVTISSSHFQDLPSLRGAIHELTVCQHITSLRLRFDVYDEALYCATADVMAVLASTVRDMELYAKDFHEVEDEVHVACQNRLIEAVASNRSLTRLKLHVEYLNATCCQFVADCVLQSAMLCELSLEALVSSSCATFLRCLLPELTHTYRLLDVTLPDYGVLLEVEMATLHDITRGNRGLIGLASRFVIQQHGDPYGASALRLVAEHPKLAETVARKASISKTLAKSMIKHALELAAPSPNV